MSWWVFTVILNSRQKVHLVVVFGIYSYGAPLTQWCVHRCIAAWHQWLLLHFSFAFHWDPNFEQLQAYLWIGTRSVPLPAWMCLHFPVLTVCNVISTMYAMPWSLCINQCKSRAYVHRSLCWNVYNSSAIGSARWQKWQPDNVNTTEYFYLLWCLYQHLEIIFFG